MPGVSIVIPTIAGRESDFARAAAAYERLTAPGCIEWIVELDHPTCGAAWNAGAARATGTYLHFTADDLEPMTAAWLPAAAAACEQGYVPLGIVQEPGLKPIGRDFPRVPFCRREWWIPVPPIHYFSDNAFGALVGRAGHPGLVADGYDFYHHRSLVGRKPFNGPEYQADRAAYKAL